MRDRHDGARVLLQVALEPCDRFRVQVIRRFVEEQEVGLLEEQAAQRDAAPLASREGGDVRIARRAAQRVHRDLQMGVEVPEVLVVDLVLELRGLVGGVVRVVFHQGVVAIDDCLLFRDAFLDIS